MQIRPVGAELFHVNRRKDVTYLIVAVRNFASTPKKHKEGQIKETEQDKQELKRGEEKWRVFERYFERG
jgi:hypothetical protein